MIPPHYFPLSTATTTTTTTTSSYSYYGIRSLKHAPLIETDGPDFASQVALKQTMLLSNTATTTVDDASAATQHHYNLALPELTELAQTEAVQLIAASLQESNVATVSIHQQQDDYGCTTRCTPLESLSLFEIGALIPDDILILDGTTDGGGFRLIGGQLCFPNGWTLSEKLGLPLSVIHETVPDFAQKLARPSLKLHEHLLPHRPVYRLNWAIKPTAQLDLSRRYDDFVQEQEQLVTPLNALDRCYFRVERQALSRLPLSKALLFTIRTYTCPISDLDETQCAAVQHALRTTPEPMLRYKGIWPFINPLLYALEKKQPQRQ
jgi:dimethylamine monooxygenase subunit A